MVGALLPGRLWFYILRRFVLNTGLVLMTVAGIIYLVECIENLRRAANTDQSIGIVFALSGLRLPWLGDQALPFAILIAAMMTFLTLSRSNELTVARATGVSAWQFSAPVVVAAAVIGAIATTVLNPLASELLSRHGQLHHTAFNSGGSSGSTWLRQTSGPDGQVSIMHANLTLDFGHELRGVSIYLFDHEDRFTYRIEADTAKLGDGRWELENVWTLVPGRRPAYAERAALVTALSPDQVTGALTQPDFLSFWQLANQIGIAESAGVSSTGFRLQYQSLLARPLLFAAMVVIAACVSLRMFRFGNITRMILGGVIAGFLLYVAIKVTGDLGAAGVIGVTVAAWAPSFLAFLLGVTVLLFTEDG